MDSTPSSSPSSSPVVPLPPDFKTIEQIYHLPNEKLNSGSSVNVIGFVKDHQAAIKTRGTDYKCTLEIVDSSLPPGSPGMKVNVFCSPDRMHTMPSISGVGDAVLIRSIKAQMRNGVPSLLSSFSTEFYLLPASRIPTATSGFSGSESLWQSYLSKRRSPTAAETAHVILANAQIPGMDLPSPQEFQEKSKQSVRVRDKFCLLTDVKPDGFYDILGEAIKIFDSSPETVTVYLSDYTENAKFYHYNWEEGKSSGSRDGDEYGYAKSRPKGAKDWPGPYGKKTIQLTLYDGHADFVREQVKVGNWVQLRNVQIKFGKIGGCLEGYLRGDRESLDGKVQVEIMKQSLESHENDPRWKEAVRRKWDEEEKFKLQKKQHLLEKAAGMKRKRHEESTKSNSKTRRKERRAVAEGKAAAADATIMRKLDLNENIRCNNANQPIVTLADILNPQMIVRRSESTPEHISPFTVCKYRANVRVVGYFPYEIEDFAVGRRVSEFDMLSDYSGGEDTDPEEDMLSFKSGKGFSKKSWEWRFALEVVDASTKSSTERLWLMVDNFAAQMLVDMDATNLRKDTVALRKLKEQLCILWGDLEEQKSALALAEERKEKISSSCETRSSATPPNRKPGDQPPIDSDDEEETTGPQGKAPKRSVKPAGLSERDSNIATNGQTFTGIDQKSSAELTIRNKAFTCCIKQYGVKVNENDPSMANAGNGERWVRKFGLFDTQIV